MTQKEKLLRKFLQNPESIKYIDLETILISLGFQKIPARGSHIKFKHPLLTHDLVIPVHNKDCKKFYKKEALKIIRKNNLLPSFN